MTIGEKTNAQLLHEMAVMRQRIAELEALDVERKRAERALRDSEERYRVLYEDNPSMYFTVDSAGTVLSVNQFGAEQLGYTVSELVGQSVLDVFHKDDQEAVLQQLTTCLENPRHAFYWEFRKIRKGSSLMWVREVARAVRGTDGKAVVLIVCEDITEHKRAEEASRESEARFRQFAEFLPHIIWMTTPDKQRVLYVNPAYEQVFGRTQEDLYSDPRSWLEAIHPEDRERVMKTTLEKEKRGDYVEEFRIVRSDGSTRWVRDRAVPIHNEQGEIYMHAGIGEDITERKEAEEALRRAHDELEQRVQERTDALHESREHFRRLVETVNVIPWEADLATWRFTYVGPQAVEILGYPVAAWFEDDFWVNHIHSEDRDYAINFCQEASLHKEDFEFEYRMLAADGRVIWLRDLVTVVPGEGGSRNLRGFMLDITKPKRLEKEILEISAREQRRIGQDLHDGLGQHLTGIAFLSKVLEHKLAAKSLEEAVEAAQIAALVNQAVTQTQDLARGLCPVQLEANGLVAALQELTSKTESLFKVSCRFQCEPPILIHDNAVATHLYYIGQEAVSNAVRHGKAQHIIITMTAENDRNTLVVKDDGIGFRDVLQEPAGMGLHIMNYRARMIDGSLTIQRNPGGGTTVTCSF